jgi:uncharacterized protein
LIYLDTSAVVKLVMSEAETEALQAWMRTTGAECVASQLLRIELLRAVARTTPAHMDQAREILKGFTLLRIDDSVIEAAENLKPPILRSLDAIHLASALMLGRQLNAFVSYDKRLADAASALGLNVMAPA